MADAGLFLAEAQSFRDLKALLEVGDGLAGIAQGVMQPAQTGERFGLGHFVVDLRRHAQMLLLAVDGLVQPAEGLLSGSEIAVRPALAAGRARFFG